MATLQWSALDQHFTGFAWKRLSAHEVDPDVSNGHEFQGVNRLKELLGEPDEPVELPCRFAHFESNDEGPTDEVEASLSWYDARRNNPDRSAEWRLYYPAEAGFIQQRCGEGDLMVLLMRRHSDAVHVLLIEAGSSWERKAKALFGISENSERVNLELLEVSRNLDFSEAVMAEEFGLLRAADELAVDSEVVAVIGTELVNRWPERLPSTAEVSALVRDRVGGVDAVRDPDEALLVWMETEEAVFRFWERNRVEKRIAGGFVDADGETDVDGFLSFSMSLIQMRRSRAGQALQNHAVAVFEANGLDFTPQGRTERGEKPDFLFPSQDAYDDASFPVARLRMLAAKTTTRDRFRQVLTEAERISTKHLLTLEAAISESLTDNMAANGIQLVIPVPIHSTYEPAQRGWLWSVAEFVADVKGTQ